MLYNQTRQIFQNRMIYEIGLADNLSRHRSASLGRHPPTWSCLVRQATAAAMSEREFNWDEVLIV